MIGKLKKLFLLVILFIQVSAAHAVFACTIISASSGDTVLFGGNEDQRPNSAFLVVETYGKFGVVYFATPWKKWPLLMQMGINEMGLCFDANWIPKVKLNPHPERKAQKEWWVTQLMREASSVEEVISEISTYNHGEAISYQVHFADKSGDAVVIHPGKDGELSYTRKAKGDGYLISTNFNLANLDNKLWSFLRFRYKTADEMLSKIGKKNDLTVEYMTSILDSTHQDWLFKTLFSVLYDLKKLRIYLYHSRQFNKPYIFDVKKELAKTNSYRKIPIEDAIFSIENE